ncbi:MAG: hypothetical protein WA833_03440 [Nitrosotalea sp.]
MSKATTSKAFVKVDFTKYQDQKPKAFYALIHAKSQFSGIGKNTLMIQKKDCKLLKSKNIKYEIIKQ